MPTNQLSHTLFKARNHDELTLPVFEPVRILPVSEGFQEDRSFDDGFDRLLRRLSGRMLLVEH
jgi:hypothetical protein